MSRADQPAAGTVRVPPHDLDAEQVVLGALLANPGVWDQIADKVGEDDLYLGDHRLIFRAITWLSEHGQAVDPLTVTAWLTQRLPDQAPGLAGLVLELAGAAGGAMAASAPAYAESIRRTSTLRRLIDTGETVSRTAYQAGSMGSAELLDTAERAVMRLRESVDRAGRTYLSGREAAREAFELLRTRAAAPEQRTGIETGLPALDELTDGLQGGDLVVLAARPAMGKTAAALGWAAHAAVTLGRPAAVFSMEMSAVQLVNRLISTLAEVDQLALRTGRLEEHEWPRITGAMTLLAEAPLYIDDTPGLSPMEVRARSRRLTRRLGTDLGLVVVDYLQLMTAPGNTENRATVIAEISRSLKALARELNVPVVALSQLNRSLEQRQDKRPVMSDLRESGAIEQDADLVVFIYRDDYYNKESVQPGQAEFIIGKHRSGPTGTVLARFDGRFTRFRAADTNSMEGT